MSLNTFDETVTTYDIDMTDSALPCELCGSKYHIEIHSGGLTVCSKCISDRILKHITEVSCNCEEGTSHSYKIGDTYSCFDCLAYKEISKVTLCTICNEYQSTYQFEPDFILCQTCIDEYDQNSFDVTDSES